MPFATNLAIRSPIRCSFASFDVAWRKVLATFYCPDLAECEFRTPLWTSAVIFLDVQHAPI
jgi:hypothetical protein